jgi:hypothetical protein
MPPGDFCGQQSSAVSSSCFVSPVYIFQKFGLGLNIGASENYLTLSSQENGSNLSAELYMGRDD